MKDKHREAGGGVKEEVGMLPEGCGYLGFEFGASYPDSLCQGGKLYDADYCNGSGHLYDPLDDIPCPRCRPDERAEWEAEQTEVYSDDGAYVAYLNRRAAEIQDQP